MLAAEAGVDRVLEHLTIEEKASLTAGANGWQLPEIASVGLNRLKMSDGPSGVRGETFGLVRSLAYPCGTAVGATWDPDLVSRYGAALAAEAKAKGVHVLLGPTVCIPRVPITGRIFESFSEDPYLAARLTVAYVQNVQRHGVACCIKHFAVNDQEHERMSISAEVDARALREIHLPAFEAAVREAGVWSVMSAYNRLNGIYCGEHQELLGRILKDEWGFDGVVISDWGGTHSTVEATTAGLDVEMPGPAQHLGPHLAEAVRAGRVPQAVLDDHTRRILRLAERTGLLGQTEPVAEREDDDPVRRALARELAIAGLVLLRNDGLLPFGPGLKRLAVIGPHSRHLAPGGGGSSTVAPFRRPSLLDELRQRLPDVEVVHAEGCRAEESAPVLRSDLLPDGLRLDYHAGRELAGAVLKSEHIWTSQVITFGTPAGAENADGFSIRATGRFVPDETGTWEFSLTNTGAAALYVDGGLVVDNTNPTPGDSFFGLGSAPTHGEVELDAGTEHELELRFDTAPQRFSACRLGGQPRLEPDSIERAAEVAASADAVLVVVGLTPEIETEGKDRDAMALPGDQDALVRRVLAANPRTVVAVNGGSAVEMDWAGAAGAVLLTWYPGEEGAPALAEVLTGAAEPGGRLPLTLPRRVEDVAAWSSYPGSDGKVEYVEGIFVGYRQFDRDGIEPAFCFGHGLGYTTFEYGEPRAAVAGEAVTVAVPVTNTGSRRGAEVVQLYVGGGPRPLPRPEQELKAFAKVVLEPGETRQVVLELDARAFSIWDPAVAAWVALPGRYELRVAASSRNVRRRLEIDYRP